VGEEEKEGIACLWYVEGERGGLESGGGLQHDVIHTKEGGKGKGSSHQARGEKERTIGLRCLREEREEEGASLPSGWGCAWTESGSMVGLGLRRRRGERNWI